MNTADPTPAVAGPRGLVPILATPFDRDGSLDRVSMRRLVEFQIECGVDGVATFGMASEGFALTAAERADILTDIRTGVPDGMPIVAGVNATSVHTALEQAAVAVDGGATALMVLPPYLVKPSAAQLIDFYGAVGQQAGAPVMIQDAPGATGVSMPVPLIVELSRLAGVTAVKIETPPTAPKLGAVVDATGSDFAVLGGQNSLFVLEEYQRGAVGTMPACEFADALRAVLDRTADGYAAALPGITTLGPLIRFGMQGPLAWAVHKHVLVRRGVISHDTVRAPAAPLDDISRHQLDAILAALELPAHRSRPPVRRPSAAAAPEPVR